MSFRFNFIFCTSQGFSITSHYPTPSAATSDEKIKTTKWLNTVNYLFFPAASSVRLIGSSIAGIVIQLLVSSLLEKWIMWGKLTGVSLTHEEVTVRMLNFFLFVLSIALVDFSATQRWLKHSQNEVKLEPGSSGSPSRWPLGYHLIVCWKLLCGYHGN